MRGAARRRKAPTTNWNDFRGAATEAEPVIACLSLVRGHITYLFLIPLAASWQASLLRAALHACGARSFFSSLQSCKSNAFPLFCFHGRWQGTALKM